MNVIFLVFLAGGILVAAWHGNIGVITTAAVNSAGGAVTKLAGFVGVMTLWLGVAKIAERSGLLLSLSKVFQPLMGLLFPSVPKNHPAMGAMLMNITANMLGLGNAATPFGLKAMGELQKLNPRKDTASTAMCTFLAINTASVTLVPATIISFRAVAGSANPAEIAGPALMASLVAALVAVSLDYYFRRKDNKYWR
ncbi:MAG: nucleoside recognition domain-containing protein [Thermincolia bacterium]